MDAVIAFDDLIGETAPTPIDKPIVKPSPYIPLPKIIKALKKTGVVAEAAKIVGCTRQAIYQRLETNGIDIKAFTDYTDDKALSHEILQHKIIKGLTAFDIEKMPGGSKVLALCQLEDKIRLQRGESTANISTKSTIEHIDQQLKDLEAELD